MISASTPLLIDTAYNLDTLMYNKQIAKAQNLRYFQQTLSS